MNKNAFIAAGAIAIVVVVWVLSGLFKSPPAPEAHFQDDTFAAIPTVQVKVSTAQDHKTELKLNGTTKADREVELRAETDGTVKSVPIDRGDMVMESEVIISLALDDRQIQKQQAEALLAQRKREYNAAVTLAEEGYKAPTQLAAAEANYKQAQAALASINLDISRTNISVPFEGILDERPVEVGDYVKSGDVVAKIVDLDPILLVFNVPEVQVHQLNIGQDVQGKLSTSQIINGKISYIAATANPETRTFRVEAEAPNTDYQIVSGLTTEVSLHLSGTKAHLISPAVLSLNTDGVIGVKTVGTGNQVIFTPVALLEDTPEGIWVGGLDDTVDLIVVGQEFVSDGQTVKPVNAK